MPAAPPVPPAQLGRSHSTPGLVGGCALGGSTSLLPSGDLGAATDPSVAMSITPEAAETWRPRRRSPLTEPRIGWDVVGVGGPRSVQSAGTRSVQPRGCSTSRKSRRCRSRTSRTSGSAWPTSGWMGSVMVTKSPTPDCMGVVCGELRQARLSALPKAHEGPHRRAPASNAPRRAEPPPLSSARPTSLRWRPPGTSPRLGDLNADGKARTQSHRHSAPRAGGTAASSDTQDAVSSIEPHRAPTRALDRGVPRPGREVEPRTSGLGVQAGPRLYGLGQSRSAAALVLGAA